MRFEDFKEKLFNKANEIGFSEFELYYVTGDNFSVQIFKHEIDKYTVSNSVGVCFRGMFSGKMGYAYSEAVDEETIDMLVSNAKMNAESIEKDDKEIIFGGSNEYPRLNAYNGELRKVGADEKINLAKQLEAETYSYSDKVVRTSACIVSTEDFTKRITNSKGLDIEFKNNIIYSVISPVVQIGNEVNNAYSNDIGKAIDDLDIIKLSHDAVDDAINSLGGVTVQSGNYNIIFKNKASASLLNTFSAIFNAENAQKGLSLLNGKEGNKIASEVVNIIDDPLLENGVSSATFDDEGVATYKKNIISKGILNTLLHNLKTASKQGISSTGNASKATYSSPIGVAPTNLYIESGTSTFDELVKKLNNGLIITDMQGLHSGAKPLTGEFSLSAKGFLVENGIIGRAVDQITISGNYYNLLNNITKVGSDFRFNLGGVASFGSPSIIVENISVAGK